MVFQDPLTSLHPMLTIEKQLTEHLRLHEGGSRATARARAVELLEQVRMPDPERALEAFPHQFSGGMRQRIAIAIALACRPRLLIADEPTTALDVTVQAGILRLLDRLRRETGLSVILITHDLGVMSAIADHVSIFYAGRIVESGPARELLTAPRHPYTRALLDALPHPEAAEGSELVAIAGAPPTPAARPSGCAFHPRCSFVREGCSLSAPALTPVSDTRLLACPVDPLVDHETPRASPKTTVRRRRRPTTARDARERARGPRRRGRLPQPRTRAGARGRGRERLGRPRPGGRARRRVGLRQELARARRGRPRRAGRGRGAASRAGRCRRSAAARAAASRPASRWSSRTRSRR